jgi:hypothetical protein
MVEFKWGAIAGVMQQRLAEQNSRFFIYGKTKHCPQRKIVCVQGDH